MTRFASDWLDLREAPDADARDVALTARLAAYLNTRANLRANLANLDANLDTHVSPPENLGEDASPEPHCSDTAMDADLADLADLDTHDSDPGTLRVLDLGAGTGANLRWLAPHLPDRIQWCLLDKDTELLDGAAPRLAQWARQRGLASSRDDAGMRLDGGSRIGWQALDLARAPLPLEAVHVVTASALIDLVSAEWLAALAAGCAAHRCAVLLALTYDGRVALAPRHDLDPRVRDAVNRHQLGDKGFGPALGPGAAATAAALFRNRGFQVMQARSDWRLGDAHTALQQALLDGWHDAAGDIIGADTRHALADWHAAHRAAIAAGDHRMRVGHVDLLALPPP